MKINRIDTRLKQLQAARKAMLCPYITAGDPEPGLTVGLMHALVAAGADMLEIGLPFSDPMAEGPVIQAAMERALAHGIDCDQVLSMINTFREQDNETPIIVMGYLNPIEQYGYERFALAAEAAGVDGTILVDLPPEESEDIAPIWQRAGLYPIYLCSPTTTETRMALINQYARGYVYYVAVKGVTGANTFDMDLVKPLYQTRKSQTTLPVMIGFGIKTPQMAAAIAEFADGVIVGAALIEQIISAYRQQQDVIAVAKQVIQSMRTAMDHGGN